LQIADSKWPGTIVGQDTVNVVHQAAKIRLNLDMSIIYFWLMIVCDANVSLEAMEGLNAEM